MLKALQISLAILGSVIGSITLSLWIVHFYPSDNALNRLYAAIFLSIFVCCALLCFSLISPNTKNLFWLSWSWWPILLVLLKFAS